MILKSLNYECLVKILYETLLKTTGLDKQCILNKDTITGPTLNKLVSEKDATSFDINDCFMLFEIIETPEIQNNYVTREDDNSISSIMSYDFNITTYGNHCHNLSQIIISNFKNDDLLINLREKGVYVNGVSYPTNVKEYINNVLWVRNDFKIHAYIRFNTRNIKTSFSNIS